MRAIAKNNERNYDIRNPLARYRRANSIGHSRSIKSTTQPRNAYISSSDWAFHRSCRLGRWGVYGSAVRQRFFPARHRGFSGSHGESGRARFGDDIKNMANMARNEMKQFLIEQIPVLFFIAMFFLVLALGG